MAIPSELIPERAFRTILLWLAWAALSVTVYFTLYLEANLLDHIQQDKSRITIVISGLFVVGVALSFSLTIAITNETKQAIELGNIAKDKSLPGVTPKAGIYAVQRFFSSLKQVLSSNTQPDLEALIDVELNTYLRRSHAVEVIGNLLITLGLIGTVVGLTMTLTGLETSLDGLGQDQERLIRGLEHAMSGMGTAFYTTLLGSVLGGVLLRIFALITDHGISNLSDTLRKICMVYCASDITPTLRRDVHILNVEVAMLGDNVKVLQGALDATKCAMQELHQAAKQLTHLGTDGEQDKTLRDSIVLQMYYSDLLKEEIKMLNKINRSWWSKLRRSVRRLRPRK